MSRSTRSRRDPLVQQENVNEPEKTKGIYQTARKLRDNNNDDKGNEILSPVLRDRTNLRIESTKVNVLKKGNQKKASEKAMEIKSTTRTLKKEAEKKKVASKKPSLRSTSIQREEDDVSEDQHKVNSEQTSKGLKPTEKKKVIKKSSEKNINDDKTEKEDEKVTSKKKQSLLLTSKQREKDDVSEDEHEENSDQMSEVLKPIERKKIIKKLSEKNMTDDKTEKGNKKIKEPVTKETRSGDKKLISNKVILKTDVIVKKKPGKQPTKATDGKKKTAIGLRKKSVEQTSDSEEKSESKNEKTETNKISVARRTRSKEPLAPVSESLKSATEDEPEKPLKKNSMKKSTKIIQPAKKSNKKVTLKVADKSVNREARKRLSMNKTANTHSKISPLKRPIGAGKKAPALPKRNLQAKKSEKNTSPDSKMRQATIKETYAKANESLRPRKKIKSPEKPKKLGPVYKNENLSDKSLSDKEKVYEFDFDVNDSKEHRPKKRKKRVIRKPVNKAKTTALGLKGPVKKTIKTAGEKKNIPAVKVVAGTSEAVKNQVTVENKTNEKPVEPIRIPKKVDEEAEKIPNRFEVVADVYDNPMHIADTIAHNYDAPSPLSSRNNHSRGPTNAIEKKKEKTNLTTTPLHGDSTEEEFQPFRPTNIFNRKPSEKYKNMMNHALLRKSFSPIVKENIPEFDVTSPWRPPIPVTTTNSFLRTKNVFQSTPQIKKFSTALGKSFANTPDKETSLTPKISKITEEDDENAILPITNENLLKRKENKSLTSPRKFGKVLSNVVNSNSLSPNVIVHAPPSPIVDFGPSDQNTLPILSDSMIEASFDENSENKENRVRKSPIKRSPIKRNRLLLGSPHPSLSKKSPIKTSKILTKVSNEKEFEPQPGPSGMQKQQTPLSENRLKQSNLHNFLNMPDMPERTQIKTTHGIFGDVHSTPIAAKPKKITNDMEVKNAFGFDDDSEIDISPIKNPADDSVDQTPKPAAAKPRIVSVENKTGLTRLSIGEIRKKIMDKKKSCENVEKQKKGDDNDISAVKEHYGPTKTDVVKAHNFSDTFDFMTEAKNEEEEEVAEVPLFLDLEPAHFTQPPKYAYNRKRARTYNTSGETEDDDDDDDDDEDQEEKAKKKTKRNKKKRKLGKVQREHEKILDEWANQLNQTFEEVENFDLVVE